MMNTWQNILKTEINSIFDPAELQEGFVDLNHLALMAIAGPDAEKFLQGQLTCDVREVTAHQTRLAAHCNPKGRVITSFRLLRLAEVYYLQLPHSMLEIGLTRLQKYAQFSKVKLHAVHEDYLKLGAVGLKTEAQLRLYFGQLPANVDDMVFAREIFIIKLPGPSRYQLLGNKVAMAAVWQALNSDSSLYETQAWDWLDIQAGIASIYPQTSEIFTPHQLNYQLVNGVSFKKGCYTGQEVITRMQYLGKLKQHMYRAELASPALISPGDLVTLEPQGESCGEVVMAVNLAQSTQMLVALQDKALEHSLWLADKPLKILTLPYF